VHDLCHYQQAVTCGLLEKGRIGHIGGTSAQVCVNVV
jgi:hypothetical protein